MKHLCLIEVCTLLLIGGFVASPNRLSAIPSTITISGYVTDAQGAPVDGTFNSQIVFYSSAASPTALDTVTTSTVITQGVFSQPITPAASTIALDEVWYSLAFDIDGNGLDPNDLMADRFQITAVPFSLSTPYVPSFLTHTYIANMSPGGPSNNLHLAVFVAPSGGVKFTEMAVYVQNFDSMNPQNASFGIYDSSGALIYSTGLQVVPPSFQGDIRVPINGRLQANKVYFTGYGYAGTQAIGVGAARPFPTLDGFGIVDNVVSGGVIPNSFNPALLHRDGSAIALVIALSLAD